MEWLTQKLGGMAFQIDIGNSLVGIATIFVAFVSLGISIHGSRQNRRLQSQLIRRDQIDRLAQSLADVHASYALISSAVEHADSEANNAFFGIVTENSKIAARSLSYVLLFLDENNTKHIIIRDKIDEMMSLDISAPTADEFLQDFMKKSSNFVRHEYSQILKS